MHTTNEIEIPNINITINDLKKDYLSQTWIDESQRLKLFKIFVPRDLNGLECSMEEGLPYLYQCALKNGSYGWCVNLVGGANYFSSFLKVDVAKQLMADEKAAFAGSGKVGVANTYGDKILLNGEWDFCTGSQFATHFTVNAKNEKGQIHAYVIDKSFVEVIPGWSIIGLNATSSYRIKITDGEVDESRRFVIGEMKSYEHYTTPKIPFDAFAKLCFSASFLGIAERFVMDLHKEVSAYKDVSDDAFNRLYQTINNLLKELWQLARDFDSIAGHNHHGFTTEAHALQTFVHQMHNTLNEQVFRLTQDYGLFVLNRDNYSYYAWKDFLVAGQHAMLKR